MTETIKRERRLYLQRTRVRSTGQVGHTNLVEQNGGTDLKGCVKNAV